MCLSLFNLLLYMSKLKLLCMSKLKIFVYVKSKNFCVCHDKLFVHVGFYSVELKRYFLISRKAVATHEHNATLRNRSAMQVAWNAFTRWQTKYQPSETFFSRRKPWYRKLIPALIFKLQKEPNRPKPTNNKSFSSPLQD